MSPSTVCKSTNILSSASLSVRKLSSVSPQSVICQSVNCHLSVCKLFFDKMAAGGQQALNLVCKYCSKNVANSVNCTVCDSAFHPSCAGRMKGSKSVSESEFVCCVVNNSKIPDKGSNKEVLTVLSKQDESLRRENLLLKQLLASKDEVVDALREEIHLLKDKIALLGEIKVLKKGKNEINRNNSKDNETNSDQKNVSDKKVNKVISDKITADSVKQSLQTVNKQLLENKQREIMQDLIDAPNSNRLITLGEISEKPSTIDEDGFTVVQNRRRKNYNRENVFYKNNKAKFNITVGTGTVNLDSTFKSQPKKMWIFVGKVGEGVKKETVEEYIRSKCSIKNLNELIVNELTTRGKSTSFQVGIDDKYYEDLKASDFWPSGIIIRRYNFWRDRREMAADKSVDGFLDAGKASL